MQNIQTFVQSKLLQRFQPNFAQWSKLQVLFVCYPTNQRWWTSAIL